MCGIAGFVGSGTERELRALHEGIKHRGPDDAGFLVRGDVGFAHARLAIIDVSPLGHQPMFSADESVAIVFNGEIYNYQELKKDLRYAFRGESDTEVILALYEKYGIDCFEKLSGMFAIALYDFKKKRLLLARDRMGEKPLYWTIQNGTLYFASELGSLIKSGFVKKEIDLGAFNQYLQFDYVPTPKTILKDVYKLEPATALVYEHGQITKKVFWRPPTVLSTVSFEEATRELDAKLGKIVARELVSDVPLGVFLSGGIDSSTVAYYAQKAHSRPIDTFSIGFTDAGFDESGFAREVAKHLGTNHHELMLSASDALACVPKISDVLSEPISDASIMPTMLLSKFARQSVTVALGGDGGDELFAGYPTFLAERVYGVYRKFPEFARRALSAGADALPASHAYFSWTYGAKKFVSSTKVSPVERHLEWLGTFDEAARAKICNESGGRVFERAQKHWGEFSQSDEGNRLLYLYARMYLMDQVLVKVDRASMHYALETRAPFLDHAIVDYVFSLPYSYKYRRTGKHLLKKTMEGKLPDSILHRRKRGFSVPLARWLANDLRDLCEDILSKDNLEKHGLLQYGEVERLRVEHREGRRDNRKELWNLMVFQLWYDRWMR
jgi:asparagine synthase (glutamine-hydrolysing)